MHSPHCLWVVVRVVQTSLHVVRAMLKSCVSARLSWTSCIATSVLTRMFQQVTSVLVVVKLVISSVSIVSWLTSSRVCSQVRAENGVAQSSVQRLLVMVHSTSFTRWWRLTVLTSRVRLLLSQVSVTLHGVPLRRLPNSVQRLSHWVVLTAISMTQTASAVRRLSTCSNSVTVVMTFVSHTQRNILVHSSSRVVSLGSRRQTSICHALPRTSLMVKMLTRFLLTSHCA